MTKFNSTLPEMHKSAQTCTKPAARRPGIGFVSQIRLVLIFLLAAATLPAAAPDYQSYFLAQLDAIRARYFARPNAFVDAAHLHVAACAAGAEVRAFQITGKKEFALSAVARMKAIAAFLDSGQEASFFVPYPFTWTYRALDQAGLLDPETRETIRRGVAKGFHARDLGAIHNQTLQRAAGLALAAQTWPDLPQAKAWKDYADAIQKMQARIEDVPENSTNYNAIDVVFTFLLADTTGHPELLRSPGIRAMYARFRDQVSPAGFIPPYGDAGDFPQPFTAAWPIENPWAMYVAGFERAANVYSDPSLHWAAARLAEIGMAHQPLTLVYGGMIDLFYFSFTAPQPHEPAAAPDVRSAILTRADFDGPAQQDKLILASSRQPGAPFLMTDLYVRGPHAHENQHGAVAYFEYQNAPLLTALGYNNRAPEHASLVLMRPSGDPFPAMPGVYPANEWREALLPTSRLPALDPKNPYRRRIDGVNLRIESSGVTVWLSDLRLAGNRTQVLDAGHSAEGWNPAPAVDAGALRWEVPKGTRFHTRSVHAEFDCREYPVLAFRWKLSNNRQQARPIILRVLSHDLSTDYHAEVIQLQPVLEHAQVDQRESDQYGVMQYSGWITPDTTLRRQMVLTKSGILIVRDRLVPGALAKGMAGGPIWQMTSNQPVRQTANWFYSNGGRMDLLTWLSGSDNGTVFGEQTTNIWSKQDQRTVFAKDLLEPGKPVVFVSVLAPQLPGTDPAPAARGIELRNEANASTVQIATPRDTVTVRVADDGAWSVKRQINFQ
jgi:hypothetical protein